MRDFFLSDGISKNLNNHSSVFVSILVDTRSTQFRPIQDHI
ncbi:hypothetical protein LEP1GSC064_1931 [Leptospira kirschneri serovar Grippotyphosa str. Moskva]|nr:hypothetical protein LEP1GSC044_2939 [Leptospira kirschneri serovar Grippotyphosa str. RM52]EKQ82520.1 hypothetical protein LEP1GSC064_1931 [Leptospira kirschneri serovar Grippotyphosa str. Moskva]EKR07555.1 hypothetical protein LEP1GSC122_2565 [Leptospira kirschneri serovar Valbuzzi str. 200702274]EMK02492.1 hypothetical protein LEP1GSC176_2355 [Leptospira kirschneri str. MMD1493]